MLNDIRAIEQAMAAHGIATGGRHSEVKDMARGEAFRVRLSANGAIVGVDLIPDAGLGAVWTLRDGQQNGFPGLKTASGLLAIDLIAAQAHRQAWDSAKTPKQQREEILRLFKDHAVDPRQAGAWPKPGHRRRIAERLSALKPLAEDPVTAAVPAAFERFLFSIAATPGFLDMLAARLATAARDGGEEWLAPVRSALIGPATLAIDVLEDEFARGVGDTRQIAAVGRALRAGTHGGGVDDICALTGLSTQLHRGNFPQPNLPGLGQTYLYARNRDIPSLSRYGRTADASFPVGSELVSRLSGAISALTQPEAKGRSWRLIPGETGDRPDLLVTSRRDLRLADAVAAEEGDDDDAIDKRTAWNDLGSKILRQTDGEKTSDAPLERAVLTVFRTVDPANRKAIYRRTVTTEEIWDAVYRWEHAAANTPEWLGFHLPMKGEERTLFRRPPFVKPLSITPLSRVLYANGGTRRVSVIGVTASDAFSLFLRDGDLRERATRLLRLLVERHGPLLAAVTAARIKGGDSLKSFDPRLDLRRDTLKSAAWLGVLLYELGRFSRKEMGMPDGANYSEDLAFRLGQFLSAADNIHKGYCVDLRSGDIPPTLIGNSVLTIASGDPVRALAILCNRMKPYLAWSQRGDLIAGKAQDQEKQGNKGRAIALRTALSQARRANEVAALIQVDLKRSGLAGSKPDDAFRAELLLGYMAGFPPRPKPQGANSPGENKQGAGEDYQG